MVTNESLSVIGESFAPTVFPVHRAYQHDRKQSSRKTRLSSNSNRHREVGVQNLVHKKTFFVYRGEGWMHMHCQNLSICSELKQLPGIEALDEREKDAKKKL